MRSLALFICCLLFCAGGSPDVRAESRVEQYRTQYLTVPPPAGWTREVIDDGLFDTCVAYDQKGTGLSVVACPGFDEEQSFGNILAYARDDGGKYVGSCFLQEQDDGVLLYVPTPGDEGAVILLMDDGMEGEDAEAEEESDEIVDIQSLFARARPVLDALKALTIPPSLYKK